MPLAELASAITSFRASLDITKAMVGLRDAELLRTKSIELQGLILDALDKAIEAREAQSSQLDRVSALESEIAQLRSWDAEKQKYELVSVGRGAMAYMLKPEARGSEPPHWLCPNCFTNGKKSFFQPQVGSGSFGTTYECGPCRGKINVELRASPRWRN